MHLYGLSTNSILKLCHLGTILLSKLYEAHNSIVILYLDSQKSLSYVVVFSICEGIKY